MATLVCSQGHPNPIGQRFCGECGEDLTVPSGETDAEPDQRGAPPPELEPATGAPAASTTRRRSTWIAIVLAVVFAVVAVGALVAGRGTDGSSTPPATTVARGDQTIVWYFPVATSDTEVAQRVDETCASHPEVGAIEVNTIDLDGGSLTPVDTHTYRCS